MASTAGPPPDPVYVFYGFNGGVSAVNFVNMHGRSYLLTGDSVGECALWDLQTMKPLWKNIHVDKEEKIQMQPSISSCGSWSRGIWAHVRGRCVRFWTLESGKYEPVEFCSIRCEHVGFCGASVLTTETDMARDDLVAVPIDKGEYHVIEIYRLLETEKPVIFSVAYLAETMDSKSTASPMSCILTRLPSGISDNSAPGTDYLLIVGLDSGVVQTWTVLENSSTLTCKETIVQESILGVDFLLSRRFGVCVSPQKTINCWNLIDDEHNSGQMRLTKLADLILPKAGAGAICIRNDGKIFAVGGWDGKIRVYTVKTLKSLAVLQFHNATVRCLRFSTEKINGRRLMAAGSSDGSLSLWNLYSN